MPEKAVAIGRISTSMKYTSVLTPQVAASDDPLMFTVVVFAVPPVASAVPSLFDCDGETIATGWFAEAERTQESARRKVKRMKRRRTGAF